MVIYADQLDSYIDTLEAADKNDYRAFSHFIGESLLDSIELVLNELLNRNTLSQIPRLVNI